MIKLCSKCGESKSPNEFHKRKDSPDGLRKECKICMNKKSLNYYNENKTSLTLYKRNYYSENLEKVKKSQKKYYNKNKDKFKQKCKNYYIANIDSIKETNRKYYKHNSNRICERMRKYNKTDEGIIISRNLSAKRRAAKKQRTPKWLTESDWLKIKDIYKQARELEKLDGIKRHVDHIIPLQGNKVSGLHVPSNLQILTAEENMKKHNNYLNNRGDKQHD